MGYRARSVCVLILDRTLVAIQLLLALDNFVLVHRVYLLVSYVSVQSYPCPPKQFVALHKEVYRSALDITLLNIFAS